MSAARVTNLNVFVNTSSRLEFYHPQNVSSQGQWDFLRFDECCDGRNFEFLKSMFSHIQELFVLPCFLSLYILIVFLTTGCILQAVPFLTGCPACLRNYLDLFCEIACSPDQSLFIDVTSIEEVSFLLCEDIAFHEVFFACSLV